MDYDDVWISIGKLAQLSGVPVESLRTWERRYGVPTAERLPSGHRRFALRQVEHLRLCRIATDAGFRPGDVLPLALDALRAMLESAGVVDTSAARQPTPKTGPHNGPDHSAPHDDALMDQWLGLAQRFELDAMASSMASAWQRRGVVRFADELAGPWLDALGRAWAAGTITVAHEHAASERLRELCAAQWRGLTQAGGAPILVLATLPGEHHQLGLQLAAASAAVSGGSIVYLGADTPIQDMARCAQQAGACAVVLSVSRFADPTRVAAALRELRAALPADVAILCGGAGAPMQMPGVVRISAFAALARWVEHALDEGRLGAPMENGR